VIENNYYLFTSVLPKVLCLLILGLIITDFVYTYNMTSKLSSMSEEDSIMPRLKYCYDDDDDPKLYKLMVESCYDVKCHCTDPLVPTVVPDFPPWLAFHKKHFNDVIARHIPIDFVLLGDTITEQWNGTSGLGDQSQPQYR
jgi:hypothetical protein